MKNFKEKILDFVIIGLLSAACSTSFAYSSTDKSSLDLPFGKEWQITSSQQKGKFDTITVYGKNVKTDHKEELFQSTLKKSFSDKEAAKEVKSLRAESIKLMQQNKCKYESISHLPKNTTFTHEWGVLWQCPGIHTSGFILFLIGDSDTMYHFTYRAPGVYPLTKEKRAEMLDFIKSIEVCYQGNHCESLL